MRAIRKKLLASDHDPEGHRRVFRTLLDKNLPGLLAANDHAAIEAILFDLLGTGFEMKDLIAE
jgi:precorrin-2 dehydrogenase/sirohydrochlorin ferrochelatase